jgi:hypothetical protein
MTIATTPIVSRSNIPQTSARSAGSVLTGLLTVVVLSTAVDAALHATGVFPPLGEIMSSALFALASAYRVLFAVLGGFVSARLAPNEPVRHALLLGAIGFFLSSIGVAVALHGGPQFGPLWYPLLLVVTAVPCSWAGARLALTTQRDARPASQAR